VADLDITLSETEKSDVLSLLEELQFDPTEFQCSTREVAEYGHGQRYVCLMTVIVHQPTGYACQYGLLLVTYSPGRRYRFGAEQHRNDWGSKLFLTGIWLGYLQRKLAPGHP
jgi:hypothetical protein